MIYDKLTNMGLYKGMNKNLDTAIDFILSHDLNELPMGKTVVDGDNVYINVIDAKAQPVEERAYEIHKNYATTPNRFRAVWRDTRPQYHRRFEALHKKPPSQAH